MDSPTIHMAKDANAQAPHATLENDNTQDSGETTQSCTLSRGVKAAVGGAVGFAFCVWITVFVAGLVATICALCNCGYTVFGNLLWSFFDRSTPLFSPALVVYLKITAAGGVIVGAGTATLALLFIAIPILITRFYMRFENTKEAKESLKERCKKPFIELKSKVGRVPGHILSGLMPPLVAFVGINALSYFCGPEALSLPDGQTLDLTRAIVAPTIGMIFVKMNHFLVKRKCGKARCCRAAATASDAAVEHVSAAQEARPVEKPLIEV